MAFDKIKRVTHFCDQSNIQLIREHGAIYSHDQCMKRGIAIPVPGGDETSIVTDKSKGLDKFVHLSFSTDHPMEFRARQSGRMPNPVYVHIKPDVLRRPGVNFTPGMANTTGIAMYSMHEAFEQDLIDYEVLFTRTNWNDPRIMERLQHARKLELLVPGSISLDEIIWLPNG